MTQTTPATDSPADYSAEDLAWFAEHYRDTEWMVHVVGPDEVLLYSDETDEHEGTIPFTLKTATEVAQQINAAHEQIEARDPSPFNPSFHATAFHRGVPVGEPFETADAESGAEQ